jgi:hypothetical protein
VMLPPTEERLRAARSAHENYEGADWAVPSPRGR